MLRPRLVLLISIILLAALSRLIPHPPNMASVTAVALFGGHISPTDGWRFSFRWQHSF